jgi:quinol monooxygenase YgiN
VIALIARYRTKDGAAADVAALLREYAPLVRAEPGCVAFLPGQSRDDPRDFVLYEAFTDQAALDAHTAAPHFDSIARARIFPLLDDRVRTLLDPIEPGEARA